MKNPVNNFAPVILKYISPFAETLPMERSITMPPIHRLVMKNMPQSRSKSCMSGLKAAETMVIHINNRVKMPINTPDGAKKAITPISPDKSDEKIWHFRLKNAPESFDDMSSRIYVVMLLIIYRISM